VEVRLAVGQDAERLTGMVQASGAYQGRHAPAGLLLGFSSLIPEAAERVGTVGPVPPGGTGERPDLWFTVH